MELLKTSGMEPGATFSLIFVVVILWLLTK